MMLLSRITIGGSLKQFKHNHIFSIKEFFSRGKISFKCSFPSAYFERSNLIFPVRGIESVRSCSSFTPQKRETNCGESANNSENELPVDMNALVEGDPALEKRVKIFLLEQEVMRQEGCRVPTHIRTAEWKELLSLTSRSSRRKFLAYLFVLEKKKENRRKKKEMKSSFEESEENDGENSDTSDRITYGFRGSTIFLRIYESTMNSFYNYNAIRAMMFGQKFVFDCSYDSHMVPRESKNCAKQLTMAFAENRLNPEPFDLYLTGGRRDCRTLSHLHKYIPTMYDDTFPLTVSENHYLELFPRETLVYLTPHCKEELIEYDHDAVYIVGAMVDKVNNEPLSLAKAKREGLKMAKLPLDRYLDWGSGSGKSLTLDQLMKILLDQKRLGDWRKSLIHVPQRKLIRENPVVYPRQNRQRPHRNIDIKRLMS